VRFKIVQQGNKLQCLQRGEGSTNDLGCRANCRWKCSAHTLHKVGIVSRVVGFPELQVILGIDEVG